MEIGSLLPLIGKRHSHEKFVREKLIPIAQEKCKLNRKITEPDAERFSNQLGNMVTAAIQLRAQYGESHVNAQLDSVAHSLADMLNELPSAQDSPG